MSDYLRVNISVKVADAAQTAMPYLAQRTKILTVPDRPYDWYLALILAGVISHTDIPPEWITHFRKVGQPKRDTKTPFRENFTEAADQLRLAGYPIWNQLVTEASSG